MDLMWIGLTVVMFVLTLGLIALCDPSPRGKS